MSSRIHFPPKSVYLSLLLAVLLCAPNFVYPLFEDAALYSFLGHSIGEGLLPYRDLIDQKPPAAYLTTYLFDRIVGNGDIGLRVCELLVILLTGLAVGLSAKIISKRSWTFHAGLLWTAALSSGLFWSTAERSQIEWYQACATAWAFYFALRALALEWRFNTSETPIPQTWRFHLWTGAFAALACWYKPQGALFATLVSLTIALATWRKTGFVAACQRTAQIAAGAILLSLPILLWMLVNGIFGDFLSVLFVDNGQYLAQSNGPSLAKTWDRLLLWPWLDSEDLALLWLLSGAALFYFLVLAGFQASSNQKIWQREYWQKLSSNNRFGQPSPQLYGGILLLLWLASAFLQYYSGRFLFRYHQIIFVPATALLLSLGMYALSQGFRPLFEKSLRPALHKPLIFTAICILAITMLSNRKYAFEWESLVDWTRGKRSTEEVYGFFGKRLHYYHYLAQKEAAKFIRTYSHEDDYVQIIGRGGTFYLHANRKPATPYVVTNGLFDASRSTYQKHFPRFMAALNKNQPKFVLIRRNDAFPWFGLPSSDYQARNNKEFSQWLQASYTLNGNFGELMWVFERKSSTDTKASSGVRP